MSWGKPTPVTPGWNQPAAAAQPAQVAPAAAEVNPYASWTGDQVLVAWEQAKKDLDKAKELELALRKESVKRLVDKPKVGTNTVELGNGYEAKVVHKINYNSVKNEAGKTDVKLIEKVQDEIEKVGNVGAVLADRLIDWKPEFSLSEYNKLDPENEDEAKIKQLLETILVATDATPTLEIKPPKGK